MTTIDEIFAPMGDLQGGLRYLHLRQRLERAIAEEALQEGAPLPSEREMAQRTGLSRVTVRKAVAPLVESGLIVQRRGAGTFVGRARKKMEQSLSRLSSFTEDMRMRGMTLTSKNLSMTTGLATPEDVMALGLRPQDTVTRLSRLRIADNRPIGIENAVIPARYLPDPAEVEHSLYAALESHGARPKRAIQRISARQIEPREATLLQVPAGAAGLAITRLSFLTDDHVVEHTSSIYRGDVYDFVAELQMPEKAT